MSKRAYFFKKRKENKERKNLLFLGLWSVLKQQQQKDLAWLEVVH